jgi:hypothetical protein
MAALAGRHERITLFRGYDQRWRAGSIAYAERQAWTWAGHVASAAREFTATNPKYRMSPGDDVN